MRRRDFIAGLGAAAVVWPISAHAQKTVKLPTIGFLGAGTPTSWSIWTSTFVQRLRDLGWVDGTTVAIEYRWAEGRDERAVEIAAEFVRLKVDVILTVGGAAAKQATSTIPIVLALSADPMGTGMVASLARPGGNITGFSIQATDLAGKRVGLLREIFPELRRLAIMADSENTTALLELGELQAATKRLGIETILLKIQRADDIAPAIESLNGRAEALYVHASPLANANRVRINALAQDARVPTMHGFREYVDSGGMVSYGPNTADLFRRAAEYVDKILRGAKPANLPVEQPTKFELVINLKIAKALGVEIPPSLLVRADEVIE